MNEIKIDKSLPEMWFTCFCGLGASPYMKIAYESYLSKQNILVPEIKTMGLQQLELNYKNSRKIINDAKIIVDWLGDSNLGTGKKIKEYAPNAKIYSFNSDNFLFEGANMDFIMEDIYRFYNNVINKDTKRHKYENT